MTAVRWAEAGEKSEDRGKYCVGQTLVLSSRYESRFHIAETKATGLVEAENSRGSKSKTLNRSGGG